MRTRFPLFWLALHRRRHLLIALAAAIALFEALIIVIARASPPNQLFASEVNAVPGLFRALSGSGGGVPITTYPGLLGFGLVHPFWVAMLLSAVGSLAAAVLAADVEAGTIELVMSRPVTRARVLAERLAALAVAIVALNVASSAAIAIGIAATAALRGTIPLDRVAISGVLGVALGFSIAGPAAAVSATGRRRAQVIGATVIIGAGGFALNFLALAWTRIGSLRYASPFHYYAPGDILAHGGVPWGSLAVLLSTATAGVAIAAAAIARRDLAP